MKELTARFQELVDDVKAGRIASVLTRSADVALVGALAAMVALMIVPLPTWLLDIFLSINITLALVILMVSVYIPNAVQITSYPTLLLITTLYRLSLDISATRLVLLNADAGEVVASFGQFVVSGNYVVGAVIFLIITLVQFIVITKGAERVAEVAARFTLDAIPGKQMSIDADLRAGTITYEQARAKREGLSRESQFYGAMDGAMKFVKGDAIAGIVITLINIIAGLIIGVAMHGMSAGEAAQVYSVLTIGSGLVSQIPALLISISAGIVITRVAGEQPDANLGSQVMGQIIAQPKAIAVAAGLVFVLALVPGLPKIPFFLLALTVGFVAWKLLSQAKQETPEQERTADTASGLAADGPKVQATVPLALKVGAELAPLLDGFDRELAELRDSLYFDTGVPYPPIPVGVDPRLPPSEFEILLNEVPALRVPVRLDCHLVPESPYPLAGLGIKGEETKHPLTERVASWIPSRQVEMAVAAGLHVTSPRGVVLLHVTAFLRRNGDELLGLQEVHAMVERGRELYPQLIEQAVPKPVPVHVLAEVLRSLARERVSIRDFRAILESLAVYGRGEENPEVLTEFVRRDLRDRICHQLTAGAPTLHGFNLPAKFQEMFRMSLRRGPARSELNLPAKSQDEFLALARRYFLNAPSTAQNPVLFVDNDIRPWVRRVLRAQFPNVAVVGFDQISPRFNLNLLNPFD